MKWGVGLDLISQILGSPRNIRQPFVQIGKKEIDLESSRNYTEQPWSVLVYPRKRMLPWTFNKISVDTIWRRRFALSLFPFPLPSPPSFFFTHVLLSPRSLCLFVQESSLPHMPYGPKLTLLPSVPSVSFHVSSINMLCISESYPSSLCSVLQSIWNKSLY